jgi:hypothetical protein
MRLLRQHESALRVRHAESRDGKECDYFELQCANLDCGARLCFGQHQVGNTLFAKRKDGEGNPLPNRGWNVYQGTDSSPSEANSDGSKFHTPGVNGTAGGLMSFEQAKIESAAAGISYESLVIALKHHGLASWNAARCTPIVRQLISAAKGDFDTGDDPLRDCPF